MFNVRTTKTASSKTAVQVVLREDHQTKIIRHVGTAQNKEDLVNLLKYAHQFVREQNRTIPLFEEEKDNNHHFISVENLHVSRAIHRFAYELLSSVYDKNGFGILDCKLLQNLVIMRIIEPASKLRSLYLLAKYFDIHFSENDVYKNLSSFVSLKEKAESIAIEYAKQNLNFNFSLVFYDVTTLYFETFKSDSFRKCGFSKDNKSAQPQILIGLMVNQDGFPVSFEVFEGNKFEGHTIIPSVLSLKKKHKIDSLTVVADAGMISLENIKNLEENGLNYIVGARISNLPLPLLKEISCFLKKRENIYFKTQTKYGALICDYSSKRAAKDKSDRKKQIAKAEKQIENPNQYTRHSSFVKVVSGSTLELNQSLIDKDEMIDGIKGYYTNLKNIESSLIVSRYKDLWHVEKSFRIAKSDLLARPVFHRKKETIEAHILIVFISLCISKSIELKTHLSIKKVRDEIWDILDIEFKDELSGNKFVKRMDYKLSNEIMKLLGKI